MEQRESLREQGVQLKSPWPWVIAGIISLSAIVLIWAPIDSPPWQGIRILAAMLQMLCMGIVIAQNAPIWEKREP